MSLNKPLAIGLVILVVGLVTLWVGACAQQNNSEGMREEQNKAIMLRVYDEAFGQGKTEVVNELFPESYIQHNPTVPNGPRVDRLHQDAKIVKLGAGSHR